MLVGLIRETFHQEGDGDFASVSDKLLGTLVRKKNLKPATPYTARVRSRPLPLNS